MGNLNKDRGVEEPGIVKPKCKLVGTDGNVYSIIANVRLALRFADQGERAKEFTQKAMAAHSYDEVLTLLHDDYVEPD